MEVVTAFVGIGANLGNAAQSVRDAIDAIGRLPDTVVTGRSSLYRSSPYEASGPDFINAVVEIVTRLRAPDLLAALQQIEYAAGRIRSFPNAPRTLDLDLLIYGSARVDSPQLTVPHPRMAERAFVLVPLAEIAPERVDSGQLAATSGQGVFAFSCP